MHSKQHTQYGAIQVMCIHELSFCFCTVIPQIDAFLFFTCVALPPHILVSIIAVVQKMPKQQKMVISQLNLLGGVIKVLAINPQVYADGSFCMR